MFGPLLEVEIKRYSDNEIERESERDREIEREIER